MVLGLGLGYCAPKWPCPGHMSFYWPMQGHVPPGQPAYRPLRPPALALAVPKDQGVRDRGVSSLIILTGTLSHPSQRHPVAFPS